MPADPYTPAELDAAVEALGGTLVRGAVHPQFRRIVVAAVLDAAAPLIAARVRAEHGEQIAQAIEATVDPYPHPCAEIARNFATTKEDQDV